MEDKYVRWFSSVGLQDVKSVGGKNASLGEMIRDLKSQGVRVPDGFAITVDSYREHLRVNGLEAPIQELLNGLDTKDVNLLRERARKIRQLILSAKLPDPVEHEIARAYQALCATSNCLAGVAVRSSATAEDLPEASFAGQQETYLNIHGDLRLLESCKKCFASLFTDRALAYRQNLGIDHFSVGLSVGVQQMVRSDLACAGVMFSIDTETGFNDVVLINSSYGLGETVVQGTVNPDEYVVFKPTLQKGFRPILAKSIGSKEFKLIYEEGGERTTKSVPVPNEERRRLTLTDEEVLQLAKWAILIERHYSHKYNRLIPMDLEWAKDGTTGELFIVQARPETVQAQRNKAVIESYALDRPGRVVLEGHSVGAKVGSGKARVIHDIHELDTLQEGEILVTERTNPDWEPVLKRAAAIVTDQGGRTCHAAIVARELGIPAVVGAEDASHLLQTGQDITVSCAEGEIGYIYDGIIPYKIDRVDVSRLPRPKTKIMMNVADPAQSFRLSFIPNDGVGLAREEFIVTRYVKIHPMALIHFDDLPPSEDKKKIADLTLAYTNKPRYFVDRLSEGIAKLAAAFYPKDVIVRFSDFKTNEYANLLGGASFEPHEENPMLGFRGASRYYHEKYREGFELECQAMAKVRNEMGLKNLKLMIPFCRTVEEGREVIAELQRNGLQRGVDGLEIYVMCEIPSNVILADAFADLFDGFSIGSNDLTQLILGVDRDSSLVADLFDERNPAVKEMISRVVRTAQKRGAKIGICGQAPSDYPEFAEFLIRERIDSLSLNPDVVLKTTLHVLNIERSLRPERATPELAH